MINVTGSIKRAFNFPSDSLTAIAYFGELSRILQYMPHISIVELYTPNQVRVLYKTLELGSYTIQIFCDLQSLVEPDERMVTLLPLNTYSPVEAEATLNSTTAQGQFALQAHFLDDGPQSTRVEYEIQLKATPPRPLGMRLMPRRVVNRIAQNITDSRIREIADGFIESTLQAFPSWQTENQLIK